MTIYAIYNAKRQFLGWHQAGSEKEAVRTAKSMVPGKPHSAVACL